jgi:hypothetical protein
LLTTLNDFKLSSARQAQDSLDIVSTELQAATANLPARDKTIIELMQRIVAAFKSLCLWADQSLKGELHAERHLAAAKAQAGVAEAEILPSITLPSFADDARRILAAIKGVAQIDDVKTVAAAIIQAPVPILCLQEMPDQWWRRRTDDDPARVEPEPEGPFVIKVMFEIENQPWSNKQILQSALLYTVRSKITVPAWPRGSDYLLIDYISTLSPDHYKITPIRIERPAYVGITEFDGTCHVEFPVGQSMFSEPVAILVRATFRSDFGEEQAKPATIVGYHQLKCIVSDKARTPVLSGYRIIDARITELVNEVLSASTPIDPVLLRDFIEALGAIANFMGISLQQALYRETKKVSEAVFQSQLLYHLRTRLGEDVQEAPKQGGGPTDIKYRSVVIELKVEDEISNRQKMIDKYLAQPAQYAAGGSSQLGILCILDQTEKHHPPANPQNQITLETPAVHGFTGDQILYPTRLAVVIIDGNLRPPSQYSR